jgi:DNA-binding Xre family transcriptional regulator
MRTCEDTGHFNGDQPGVNPEARRGRRPKGKPAEPDSTRLQQWLDDNGFTSAELEAATGLSRQAMTKIRRQVGDVRRTTMIRILDGACALAKRKVRMEEIFDIEPEKWSE